MYTSLGLLRKKCRHRQVEKSFKIYTANSNLTMLITQVDTKYMPNIRPIQHLQ